MECFAKILNKHNSANYIFTGSCINLIKYIFKETEWFSARDVEMIQLASIESKPFTNYIISTFKRTGSVIEKDMQSKFTFVKASMV